MNVPSHLEGRQRVPVLRREKIWRVNGWTELKLAAFNRSTNAKSDDVATKEAATLHATDVVRIEDE